MHDGTNTDDRTTAAVDTAAAARAAILLNRDAVAALLGCSAKHVGRLADSGRMPAPVRLGWLVRWRRGDVERWIAEGCPRTR